MPLHFAEEELLQRRQRCCAQLQKQDLDGILMFRQESMFYLTPSAMSSFNASTWAPMGP